MLLVDQIRRREIDQLVSAVPPGQAHQRHKDFLEHIARRAAALNPPRRRSKPVAAAAPRPFDYFEEIAWQTTICEDGQDERQRFSRIEFTHTTASIQKLVCEHYRVFLSDMIGPCREHWIMIPRWVAMYLCRHIVKQSFPEIGRRFGGRDHSSVLNAVRHVERWLKEDQEKREEISPLLNKFGEVCDAA